MAVTRDEILKTYREMSEKIDLHRQDIESQYNLAINAANIAGRTATEALM